MSSSPITSSLTQSVSNASRASLAVRTASAAVKQPGGVGEHAHPVGPEHVEDPAPRPRVDAPHGHGGQRRARGLHDGAEDVGARDAARCRGSAASPGSVPAIDEVGRVVVHRQPPAAAVTISTTSRGDSRVVAHSLRGTTSRLRATAMPVGDAHHEDTRSATVAPGCHGRGFAVHDDPVGGLGVRWPASHPPGQHGTSVRARRAPPRRRSDRARRAPSRRAARRRATMAATASAVSGASRIPWR